MHNMKIEYLKSVYSFIKLNYKCPKGTVDDSNKCLSDTNDTNVPTKEVSKITEDDLSKAIERAERNSPRSYDSDALIQLDAISSVVHDEKNPDKEILKMASDRFGRIDKIMKEKNIDYDIDDAKYRILTSNSLLEGGDLFPFPVYVSANNDKMTVGLLLSENGKFEMFDGNEEATPETQQLVNDLLEVGDKTVTVYGSHTPDIIQRIKSGDLPEGIFVSPSKEYAAGFFGLDRDLVKFKIPLNRIQQISDVDWRIMPKPKVKDNSIKRNYKCPKGTVDNSNKCDMDNSKVDDKQSDYEISKERWSKFELAPSNTEVPTKENPYVIDDYEYWYGTPNNNEQDSISAKTYFYNGIQVISPEDNEIRSMNMIRDDAIENAINSMHPTLRKYLECIQINPFSEDSGARAEALGNTLILYGDQENRYSAKETEKELPYIFNHEAAHMMDNANKKVSKSDEYISAIKADGNNVTPYSAEAMSLDGVGGRNGKAEDFAEAVAMYVTDKNNFKEKCPNRAKFLEDKFFGTS